MEKFLVTGGAGFIGSHIVERLVKLRYKVKVLDNFSSGTTKNLFSVLDKIELIKGDIRNAGLLKKITKGVDFVLHQAALRSVPKSLHNPKDYNDVNIQGTLNMLEAARENKIKCFVFASSSSIYGQTKRFPEKEEARPELISPYALTKLAGEYYCRIFTQHYGLNTVCLRYFNVFGPRQSLDDEYAVVIPKFITCILKDEPVPIYGAGRQSRDFTYVSNVVDANLLAVRKQNSKGKVFNIACGRDYTILDLAKILNRIIGKDTKPIFLTPRPGDVFKTLADLTAAKKILGFWPKRDFISGLEKTVEWFKKERQF